MIDSTLSSEQRARKAAQALADAVNEMGFDTKSFADELCNQHRTLQQNAFRAMGACLVTWAAQAEPGRYDARNEYTVKTSKSIVEAHPLINYAPHI